MLVEITACTTGLVASCQGTRQLWTSVSTFVCVPLSHSGIPDKQLEATYANPSDNLVLPDVGNWVVVVVTAIVSATKFYIQMPLGAKSPLSAGSVPGNVQFSMLQ